MTECPGAPVVRGIAPTPSRSRAVAIMCFVIALLDGYDTLMLSFLAPLIARDWGLGHVALGAVFAAGYAGALLGAVVCGTAADRFGRKRLLLVSMAIGGAATVACAAAGGTEALMAWRFVAGVGLGGAIPCASALTAEHTAPRHRTTAVTRMFLGFPIGAVAGGALTASAMSTLGWRAVFVGGGVVSLLLVPAAFLVITEQRGAGRRTGSPSRRPIMALVGQGRLPGTVLLCLSAFLILLVSYFLVSWLPAVLAARGTSSAGAALANVVLNLGGVVGALAMSAVFRGRAQWGAVSVCLGIGGVLTALLGQSVLGDARWTLGLVLALGAFVLGGQLNLPGLAVDCYPEGVRATGVGLVMGVGRLGSIVGPLLGGYLVSAGLGPDRLFLWAGLPAFLAALALAAARPRGPVL